MKNSIPYIILITCLLYTHSLKAQDLQNIEFNLAEFIQKMMATQQDNVNYEDLYEALMQYHLNPIDLNKASADKLRSLFILSEIQIQNLINHRKAHGELLNIYELQGIEAFDIETIQSLLPFAELGNPIQLNRFKDIFKEASNHYLVLRMEQTLEKSKGYLNGKFLGSRQKLYVRYRLQRPKDFSLGFIIEKDQGEPNYFDYSTFHIQFQNKGILKNAIIGDYQLQFGQGLIVSSGFAIGKGSEPIYTTRRSDLGIRPHNSVVEGGYFRGLASSFQTGPILLTTFASIAKRDASINMQLENTFSSILSSGLHRSESEINKKGVLQEFTYGVNGKWQFENGHLGFTVLNSNFNQYLERNFREYAIFEFKGKQNLVFGPNFSYSWQNFNFFGEVARSSSGGIGGITGFVASLSPTIEWSFNIRNYGKEYHSFFSNGFGEGSRTINEKGLYSGLKFTPKRGISIAAFYDRFKFPWLRYLVDAPSNGHGYLLRFTLNPSKKWLFYTQFQREQKEKNLPNNISQSDFLVQTIRQSYLSHFEFQINQNFKSQTRFQYNAFQYQSLAKSNGFALIQDIEGRISKLSLKSRIAIFNTDSYDSRIYAYENDLRYTVSFPAYFGKGMRLYLVAQYAMNRHLNISGRIARTELQDEISISSGDNEINKPHKTDIKFQIEYKF